jgi:LacI family transcriptional regulator
VTVADIAKAAGVAKATAARALGGYGPVSEEVRDRVLGIADKLGYRPNALARSMNTGRSTTIGVVVGDVENPFFGRAIRAISDTAKEAGYDVLLANSGEELDTEKDAVDVLLDKRVDAIIVAPASSIDIEHLHAFYATGRPVVLFDRRAQDGSLDSVTIDNRAAAAAATRRLLTAGHTRIGYISTMEHADGRFRPGDVLPATSVADRVEGILSELAASGVEEPGKYLRFNGRSQGIAAVTTELFLGADAPTALIASDSIVGLGAFTVLRDAGLSIPADVSIITFDDADWTRITSPPLDVMAQPVYEMGVAAAKIALARIRGAATDQQLTFAAELRVRESVAAPRRRASSARRIPSREP